MGNKTTFTATDVKSIANLAKIPTTQTEQKTLAAGFNSVIAVIDKLSEIDTSNVEPTHQVTGLENVLREDKVDENRMLSQEQALSNANNTHNGFFVVDQILEGD